VLQEHLPHPENKQNKHVPQIFAEF
jgi:hypothetical protein